jgi:lipopolysaccharide/colanic/teichoic acid biosynthesis glycosyltransferase
MNSSGLSESSLNSSQVTVPSLDVSRTDLGNLICEYGFSEASQVKWLKRLKLRESRGNLTSLSMSGRITKRAFDLILAFGMLLFLSPLLLITWCAVRLTSPGAAIYSQTRVGLNRRSEQEKSNRRQLDREVSAGPEERRRIGMDRRQTCNYGRPFTIYKLRTMRMDAEISGAQFAQENDPRITPIGRFLRRTRIDELPQLWNILRGDMSLIGPRPERPEFMEQLSDQIPGYLDRLGLKPGLSGVAQILNGYDNEVEGFRRKVGYDLLYLQNCCVQNDLKILLRTVRVVITGEGAR